MSFTLEMLDALDEQYELIQRYPMPGRNYKFTLAYILCLCTLFCRGQERLIILNEGNWQSNNARISYFEDGVVVSNKWFEEKNGYGIGDTPNDILQVGPDLIAIAINWSNIIQYITTDGMAVAATEDVPNNRKLATDGKHLYITSYAHECLTVNGFWNCEKGFVAKVNLETFQVEQCCEVGWERFRFHSLCAVRLHHTNRFRIWPADIPAGRRRHIQLPSLERGQTHQSRHLRVLSRLGL